MPGLRVPLCGIGMAAAICGLQPLRAQEVTEAGAVQTASAPAVDPSTIPLPELAFAPTARDVGNYDKYYYFHRAETDFATAYADIQECDGYARGLPHNEVMPNAPVPYPYAGTMAGAIGGAIGNAIVGAIISAEASAERRRQRRSIMRTCMGYKGYQAYGLRKSLWETFNFEEGSREIPEDERQRLLQIQARVASGPVPTVGEIRR